MTTYKIKLEKDTNDLINPRDGTRVREVSAGIGNWRDGKGVVHKDVIRHVALCTLPVKLLSCRSHGVERLPLKRLGFHLWVC